jgi:N-acetylneuraminate synthase
VAAYPTPLDSINVRVVDRIQEELGVMSGLSDHTLDPVTAPCAAVSLGGAVVEKHFTLDRSMNGPDHDASLEPDELDRMIDSIRNIEMALGSKRRGIYDVESELHDIARRHVHATETIERGERLTENNISVLRSGEKKKGLDPEEYDSLLGMRVSNQIDRGQGIRWDDVEDS